MHNCALLLCFLFVVRHCVRVFFSFSFLVFFFVVVVCLFLFFGLVGWLVVVVVFFSANCFLSITYRYIF